MGRISSKRLAFLAELDNPVQKMRNKGTIKYINNWISRNYSDFVDAICWNFNVVRKGGMCSFDYLNDCIINIYNDHSLQFKNQSECDIYMEKELNYRRFIISVRIIDGTIIL